MTGETATVAFQKHERHGSDAIETGHKYLYALVSSGDICSCGLVGIKGRELEIITAGRIAAVVSDIAEQRIRPERRHLAAHQLVLKLLMASTTPLPTSFGMIADDAEAIRKILNQNQREIADQLRRVAGKVEMGLRVNWDVPNIFEYFVQTHQELRAARDRFLGSQREPAQEDKIEVGRRFEQALREDRELYTRKVQQILAPICVRLKVNKCHSELEVMNLACLVERSGQDKFSDAVFEAAKLFDNNFSFDYSGPWAPHNFVELDLKL